MPVAPRAPEFAPEVVMPEAVGEAVSVEGHLMCTLCGSQWEDHLPFVDDDKSRIEGCLQALGRRLGELDVRTAGVDPIG